MNIGLPAENLKMCQDLHGVKCPYSSKVTMAAVTVSFFAVYREQLQDLSLDNIIATVVSAVQLNELCFQNQIKSQLYLNNNVGRGFLENNGEGGEKWFMSWPLNKENKNIYILFVCLAE